MPASSADPRRLAALGAPLTPLRDLARTGADEVLGHYPELGERELTLAADALLEQAADALRALEECATELASRLHLLGLAAAPGQPTPPPGPPAGSPVERRRRS